MTNNVLRNDMDHEDDHEDLRMNELNAGEL